jgi:predicted ATP-binding protein involved in virulence
MIYINAFNFPNEVEEINFITDIKRTCYDTYYHFNVLSRFEFKRIDFEPITILYGGNGSGKSTALNIIAEKTGVKRDAIFNKSNFFNDYIEIYHMKTSIDIPEKSRIIVSDDVFDHMLNIRNLNEKIDLKIEELFDEFLAPYMLE